MEQKSAEATKEREDRQKKRRTEREGGRLGRCRWPYRTCRKQTSPSAVEPQGCLSTSPPPPHSALNLWLLLLLTSSSSSLLLSSVTLSLLPAVLYTILFQSASSLSSISLSLLYCSLVSPFPQQHLSFITCIILTIFLLSPVYLPTSQRRDRDGDRGREREREGEECFGCRR